jgi:hypothetical protein
MGATRPSSSVPGAPESDDATNGDKSGARDHLTDEFQTSDGHPLGDGTAVCTDCDRRVTISEASGREYGHERGCPHGRSGGDGA